MLREDVAILWNYIIEVQDLIAEIRTILDGGEYERGVTQLLRAGQTPQQILDDMIAAAKGDPIRADV